MFSKPEMVRKELYCTKSVISKFAVHRHFNSTLSHIGNTIQEYIVCIKSAVSALCLGKLLPGQGRD